MTSPPDPSVVGTYASADEAERARRHLSGAGIEPVEVRQLSRASWQVEAPMGRRREALDLLQRLEQHIIPDAW